MHKVLVFLAFSFSTLGAMADSSYARGVQTDPCAQVIPQGQQLNLDFGQLCHYEAANSKLAPASNHRVVYFGDSLTELWGARVPGLQADDVLNRGISGQTTSQMLVRFRADVLNLHPRVVHMLMGTNDIAGNTGATSLARIQGAIASMVEQARAHHIRVVLASILPAKTISWREGVDPVPQIQAMNRWLEAYARREKLIYVNYFAALNDGRDGFLAALTTDGVHPNHAGYNVMIPLARAAIEQANAKDLP